MGLTTSLSTALTGLKASQQSISVLAQNIANANNSKYTRQIVTQSAITSGDITGSGVKIDEVTRVVDGFINKTVIARSSLVARAGVISSYTEQAQTILGQPGKANSIDTYTQKFFQDLHTLATDSGNSTYKYTAVASAVTLTNQVSALAKGIEELRFQADKEIEASVKTVNNAINKLYDLNRAIASAATLGQSSNTIADEIDAQLAVIANEINIQYTFNEFNQVAVSTTNGSLLIDQTSRYQLRYSAANSVQQFIDDDPSASIEVLRVDTDGTLSESSKFNLVTGGTSDQVTSPLTGGKIQGLIELRDSMFTDVLTQLDNFAATVRDEVNAVYNNGASYPPSSSLNGTTLIDPTQLSYWNGSVMIAAVQNSGGITTGQAVNSPYASEEGMKPLTLNLSTLTDEAGPKGTFTFQSIIDEINNYYGIPQNKVSIGRPASNTIPVVPADIAISNIELVAKSDSLTAGTGTFNFNLETTNLSANNRNYTITGITTSDPNIVVSQPATFPTPSFTSAAGQTALTSDTNFSLNMSNPAVGNGPYTVSVQISVDDGQGGFYTDTIDYVITPSAKGLMNDRFAASAVSGTGDATIELPTTNQPALYAKLVDANGVEIPKDPVTGDYLKSGYLKIEGANGVGVAIAELDSTQLGTASSPSTGYGFSHYFGLNNFFETGNGTNPSKVSDAAITFKVRSDIAASPGLIAMGALRQSAQPTAANSMPRYTYEISSGGNTTILALDALSSKPIKFKAAGGISGSTVTFNNYASQILGFSASIASQANSEHYNEQLIYQGFVDKKDSIGGVNIDEEVANTITYQNAYTANARVISVINEMFDALLQAF